MNSFKIKVFCIIVLLYASVSCAQHNSNPNQDVITASNFEKIEVIDVSVIKREVLGKDVQFIDIRTPKEYQEGFIDDAVNISYANKETFTSKFEKLNKQRPIYIYCYSGWRSHRAAKLLVSLGFNKVYDFKGGYKAWTESTK
ncbi:rhodanese-like domain-containing protein [Aquimarina litoralis]|uniref:rhodanese-like domain-containing protein n=1 Tax=Aquimarina litoralis TaxID=584605 RepID=UPI001C55E7E8|nr:rhodanese-like domain-containing protein [Aquimarina litoralis]